MATAIIWQGASLMMSSGEPSVIGRVMNGCWAERADERAFTWNTETERWSHQLHDRQKLTRDGLTSLHSQ